MEPFYLCIGAALPFIILSWGLYDKMMESRERSNVYKSELKIAQRERETAQREVEAAQANERILSDRVARLELELRSRGVTPPVGTDPVTIRVQSSGLTARQLAASVDRMARVQTGAISDAMREVQRITDEVGRLFPDAPGASWSSTVTTTTTTATPPRTSPTPPPSPEPPRTWHDRLGEDEPV